MDVGAARDRFQAAHGDNDAGNSAPSGQINAVGAQDQRVMVSALLSDVQVLFVTNEPPGHCPLRAIEHFAREAWRIPQRLRPGNGRALPRVLAAGGDGGVCPRLSWLANS